MLPTIPSSLLAMWRTWGVEVFFVCGKCFRETWGKSQQAGMSWTAFRTHSAPEKLDQRSYFTGVMRSHIIKLRLAACVCICVWVLGLITAQDSLLSVSVRKVHVVSWIWRRKKAVSQDTWNRCGTEGHLQSPAYLVWIEHKPLVY